MTWAGPLPTRSSSTRAGRRPATRRRPCWPPATRSTSSCPRSAAQTAQPLPHGFYLRPTLDVARDLLGRTLVRTLDGQRLAGRISEVEAYVGEDDLASHAARGPSPRNRSMYGPGGLAYVYLIYGMHHCLNVVTEDAGFPAAVLIRAIEPLEGVDVMQANRAGRPLRNLAERPGQAVPGAGHRPPAGRPRPDRGRRAVAGAGEPVPDAAVQTTPRVNVGGDKQARTVPWRFVLS